MGNTRNLWPTCCPNQHEIVAEHIGKSEDGPTTKKKNSHWHDIFLMIKHGTAGDRLVRAYSNGSLPSLRPLHRSVEDLDSNQIGDWEGYLEECVFHRAPIPGATWSGSFMGPALGEKMVKSWLFFNNPRGCWDDRWSVDWSEIGMQKIVQNCCITNMVADLKGSKGLFSKSHPSWGMKPHET